MCVCVWACSIYSDAKLFQDLQRVSQTLQVSVGQCRRCIGDSVSWGPQHLSKSTVISFRKSSLRTCLRSASRVIQTLCKSYMLIATRKIERYCWCFVQSQGLFAKHYQANESAPLLAHLLRHGRIRFPLHACSKPWSHIAPITKRPAAPVKTHRECVAVPTIGVNRSLSCQTHQTFWTWSTCQCQSEPTRLPPSTASQ